ncbi:MAG: 30S ribosome-binding factor RbfA [Clostridia bacterium]|nr:30S ribosome-binding factor RbfA [Clostridia bacterium]
MTKTSRKPNRIEMINSELQREIYGIITRKLKNPLITEMVSVLKVDTAKDLSNAKVYLSVYSKSEEKRLTTFNAIAGDSGKIRYELSQTERMRRVPELRFILDDSLDYGDKMDKLFIAIEKGEKL